MTEEQFKTEVLEILNFLKENMVTRSEFDERLDVVDNRLTAIENRLTAVESKIAGIHRRVDGELDGRKQLEVRIERLEATA